MSSKKIENKVAYFNKVLRNMDRKELGKQIIFDDHEGLSGEIEYIACTVDKYFCDNNLLEWIELIENSNLHKALKSLTVEEQALLSYVYYKEKTYSEIAKMYKRDRSVIGKIITKALRKVKLFLCEN